MRGGGRCIIARYAKENGLSCVYELRRGSNPRSRGGSRKSDIVRLRMVRGGKVPEIDGAVEIPASVLMMKGKARVRGDSRRSSMIVRTKK